MATPAATTAALCVKFPSLKEKGWIFLSMEKLLVVIIFVAFILVFMIFYLLIHYLFGFT